MWVCFCRSVNSNKIQSAIDDGAESLNAVSEACGAGTDCGGCKRTIQAMIKTTKRNQPGILGRSLPRRRSQP
jgi:bacterioferritin-associated ferredoxin